MYANISKTSVSYWINPALGAHPAIGKSQYLMEAKANPKGYAIITTGPFKGIWIRKDARVRRLNQGTLKAWSKLA